MRGIASILGLVVTLAIGLTIYKFYFSQIQATTAASPKTTVDVIGVKGDLLAIAQAERIYQAEHSSFASLSDLTASGAMSMSKPGRDGYSYDVDTAADNFHVVAHCPSDRIPGCANYSIDNSMEIQTVP